MAEQELNLRLLGTSPSALPTELPAKERPGLSTGTHRGVKNRIRAAVNTLIELCIPIDMEITNTTINEIRQEYFSFGHVVIQTNANDTS